MNKNDIINRFSLFTFGKRPGLGKWLSADIHSVVADRLGALPSDPLSKVQFNQLLVISGAASVSDGFFHYYWLTAPRHTYDVETIEGHSPSWLANSDQTIKSLEHLRWGLYRLYVDGLLYFGNVRAAFESLRSLSKDELDDFFQRKRFDTEAIASRGPAMPLNKIEKDARHLISEMACKNFGELPTDRAMALSALTEAWQKHQTGGGGAVLFKDLVSKYVADGKNNDQLTLSYDELSTHTIDSEAILREKFDSVATAFLNAREKAIGNTERYLSMVNDLDVYVATSMRTRKNFRDMADACDAIFQDSRLKHLHLRYFDPTLSAAKGHEDKGLIECLMVKCAKVLVYCEGEKESYGKDAEAAMALSLGKPVVFYCDHGKKTNFYRDVHPLARLIDFRSGVAVGALVTDNVSQVTELLRRIFENKMEYRLEHHAHRPGYLKLVESLTGSVSRLQTDDEMITTTFWNNYHNRTRQSLPSLASGKEAERLYE